MSAGYPIEEAAQLAGIDLTDCFNYLKERKELGDATNIELKKAGQEALKVALKTLTALTKGGERVGKDFESTDFLAARELARTALAAIKLSKESSVDRNSGQRDLFDNMDDNPWILKKIE